MVAVTYVAAPIPPGAVVHGQAFATLTAVTFNPPTRAIYIGGAGALTVTMNGDTAPVTLPAVPVGTWLKDFSISAISASSVASGVAFW